MDKIFLLEQKDDNYVRNEKAATFTTEKETINIILTQLKTKYSKTARVANAMF